MKVMMDQKIFKEILSVVRYFMEQKQIQMQGEHICGVNFMFTCAYELNAHVSRTYLSCAIEMNIFVS